MSFTLDHVAMGWEVLTINIWSFTGECALIGMVSHPHPQAEQERSKVSIEKALEEERQKTQQLFDQLKVP